MSAFARHRSVYGNESIPVYPAIGFQHGIVAGDRFHGNRFFLAIFRGRCQATPVTIVSSKVQKNVIDICKFAQNLMKLRFITKIFADQLVTVVIGQIKSEARTTVQPDPGNDIPVHKFPHKHSDPGQPLIVERSADKSVGFQEPDCQYRRRGFRILQVLLTIHCGRSCRFARNI